MCRFGDCPLGLQTHSNGVPQPLAGGGSWGQWEIPGAVGDTHVPPSSRPVPQLPRCSLKSHRALACREVPIPAPAVPGVGVAVPAASTPSGDSSGPQQVTATPGGHLGCGVGILCGQGAPGQHPGAARARLVAPHVPWECGTSPGGSWARGDPRHQLPRVCHTRCHHPQAPMGCWFGTEPVPRLLPAERCHCRRGVHSSLINLS